MQTQWGITGAGPHESRTRTCSNRCEMERGDKTYNCEAKACGKEGLCQDCAYLCADCHDEFCVEHVIDVHLNTRLPERYVCLLCAAKLYELKAQEFRSTMGGAA